uniref:Dilute domain-containing protein n=1 Tax=Panagrolaimus sp. JU765 TaxID=591449 RepID=A0AC34Q7T9_9BILA
MYAFNWLVKTRDGSLYLSRQFGIRLRERLMLINRWSEQQGLELAAECHLDRIQQTVNLLITPKTIDQIASLGATTYKLNSLQVRYLLENYVSEVGESRATRELIEHVVSLAQGQADLMSQQDGQKIQLEENSQLFLPFVFPQDGYVVETLHGIPSDMSDFIASLQTKGICRLMPQIGATGSWTVYMPSINQSTSMMKQQEYSSTTSSSNSGGTHGINGYPSSQASTYRITGSPTIVNIFLKRFPGDSIGLSIVAAQVCLFF